MSLPSKKNKIKVEVARVIDFEEVISFLGKVYGTHDRRAAQTFRATIESEPYLRPRNFILARNVQGDLVGMVRIVERQLLVDRVRVVCGGITSVAVSVAWQKQGICSAMMEKALDEMARRGMDISILHARRALDGYYSRFGYYGIGRYVDLTLLNAVSGAARLRAVPFRRPHLAYCRRQYDRIYTPLTGSMVRPLPVWKWLIHRMEQNVLAARIFIIMDGPRPAGYGAVKEQKLVELAVAPRFFPSVSRWVRERGLVAVSLHPRHPFTVYCRGQLNTQYQERRSLDGGYMARVVREDLLLDKFRKRKSFNLKHLKFPQDVVWVLGVAAAADQGPVSLPRGDRAFFPDLSFHTSVLDEV